MRTATEIDGEIQKLKEELEKVEGRPTEVYTRIVGYYRSLRNWNRGKREEYDHRTLFVPGSAENTSRRHETPVETPKVEVVLGNPVRFMYFFRPGCPNCPAVVSFLGQIEMPGCDIDVDTENGSASALRFNIYSTPTAIFFDSHSEEVFRATSIDEIRRKLPEALLNIPQTA